MMEHRRQNGRDRNRLDSRIKTCVLMYVIAPKLEYAQEWDGREKFVKQLKTVQMAAFETILGC